MLPQRRGLGGADQGGSVKVAGGRVKKTRGGEKSRRKKHAERARQAKEAERDKDNQAEIQEGPGSVGLFSFINNQLGESGYPIKSNGPTPRRACAYLRLRG
jgi:hypothetical protein